MRLLLTLYHKELKSYFLSPFGWIVLAFAAAMQGWSLTTAMTALSKEPSQHSLVWLTFQTPNFWFYFLFLFPLITMRLFAEEERSGTLETMLTAPVSTWQMVLSKYAAAFTFYATLWIPTIIQFQLFKTLTDIPAPYNNGALAGLIAIVLLIGAFYVAVGCLASALTSSQIIAGIITCGLLLLHFVLGYITFFAGDSFAAAPALQYLSSQKHLSTFSKGLVDTRPLVYYLTMAAFTLLLTLKIVDFRRWRK